MLPDTDTTPVLRTDFSDQSRWEQVRSALGAAAERISGDDLYSYLDDPRYAGLTPDQVLALLPDTVPHAVIAVVDATTLASPEMPVLVVDLSEERGRQLRCTPEALVDVDGNTEIGNMDFAEFADMADADGVLRGEA